MSELADRLQADLVAAMKDHDELTRSTLRMAIASIKNGSCTRAGCTGLASGDTEMRAGAPRRPLVGVTR